MRAEEPQSSLHGQVRRAVIWVAIRQIAVRGLSILQLLVLVRILSPEDFGLFAIAMMVYAFVEAMTFLGFGHALIQKKTVEPADLNTIYVVNVVRGILLALLVWAASYPVGMLMKSPASQPLIAIIGFLPLIMGFYNPAMILFQKELRMKQEFSFYSAGALANLLLSLWFAMRGAGVWALIWGLLAQSMAQLVLSYVVQKYRPKFEFNKTNFAEMFHFGKWLLASQGLKYFSNNLPSWIIGQYFGANSLGQYHVAGRFSQAIGNEFTTLISTVAFPSFSKLQSDIGRLSEVYIRSQRIVLSAAFLLFGCLIALSESIATVVLGEKWSDAGSLIMLLSILGALQSIGSQSEILKALNKTRYLYQINAIRLFFIIISIIPLCDWFGAKGAVVSIVATLIFLVPIGQIIILKELKIPSMSFIKIVSPPALSAAAMYMTSVGIIGMPIGLPSFTKNGCILIATYALTLFLLDKMIGSLIFHEWKFILFKVFK